MNILNKLGFYKNADEMLKTDPTKAIPISEQNRLKKQDMILIGYQIYKRKVDWFQTTIES